METYGEPAGEIQPTHMGVSIVRETSGVPKYSVRRNRVSDGDIPMKRVNTRWRLAAVWEGDWSAPRVVSPPTTTTTHTSPPPHAFPPFLPSPVHTVPLRPSTSPHSAPSRPSPALSVPLRPIISLSFPHRAPSCPFLSSHPFPALPSSGRLLAAGGYPPISRGCFVILTESPFPSF